MEPAYCFCVYGFTLSSVFGALSEKGGKISRYPVNRGWIGLQKENVGASEITYLGMSHVFVSVWLRSSLFWYVTQLRVVPAYRRFGIICRSQTQSSHSPILFLDCLNIEVGTDRLSRNVCRQVPP